MNYFVYKHTSPTNKVYIGITSQKPEDRWGNGRGYNKQSLFYNAILKYGWNNFKHEVLFSELTKEEAEQKEIELIKYYKSNLRQYGYNIDNGGNSIGKHSNETKLKISKSHIGIHAGNKNPCYGRTGKKHPMYGRTGDKNPMYGKIRTGEQCYKKIKEKCSIPVNQYTKDGQFIKTYSSTMEVEKELGIYHNTISKCCKGKYKSAGGFIWRYKIKKQLADNSAF